jgi:hypothetical protein
MPVPVMHVGHMRVRMPHRRMAMKMRVRFARRVEAAMGMAVVLVVTGAPDIIAGRVRRNSAMPSPAPQ